MQRKRIPSICSGPAVECLHFASDHTVQVGRLWFFTQEVLSPKDEAYMMQLVCEVSHDSPSRLVHAALANRWVGREQQPCVLGFGG